MAGILVTGGAGYVGGQTVLHFKALGWRVVVLDNLSTGHQQFADLADQHWNIDLTDAAEVHRALASESFDGIVHCAARSLVPESVQQPIVYLRENMGGALNLIEAAAAVGAPPIVFSSSAATYGEPTTVPIPEHAVKEPLNAYGFSKLAIEKALQFSEPALGTRSVCLRYFNAAGADPLGRVGERHAPETHLVPNLILAELARDRTFRLFGTDYPTADGSCVRDFVHTLDVARAHEAALRYLWSGGPSAVFNIGSGSGYSVMQVVETVNALVDHPVAVERCPRRPGDPAVLVADIHQAQRILGWCPRTPTCTISLRRRWRGTLRPTPPVSPRLEASVTTCEPCAGNPRGIGPTQPPPRAPSP